jgi:phosphate:Na+ symporter
MMMPCCKHAFALNPVQESVLIYYVALLNHIKSILTNASDGDRAGLLRMQIALDDTNKYLDKIKLKGSADTNWERMLALVHALDHLQRLHERCEEDEDRAITARETADLSSIKQSLISAIEDVLDIIMLANRGDIAVRSRQVELDITEQVDPMRDIIASSVANGRLDVPAVTVCLEAIRWLVRVSHHISRNSLHIQQAVLACGK